MAEADSDPLGSFLANPLVVRMSTESPCPQCGQMLQRAATALSGPYSGIVFCEPCGFRQSVVVFLGKSMIQVEPLPGGANEVFYADDSDDGGPGDSSPGER